MGKCKGCGKLGRMLVKDGPTKSYRSALLCSPVVSVWDCIVLFMDNKVCNKVQPVVRKAKKKQVKDELDRIKQAEKKKRRLEKALATSAAICSELGKKKQKKKEEQQRLDEEGAAIAEAVALHVLLGEDSDDSCKVMLRKEEGFNCWDYASNIGLFMGGGEPCHPHRVHTNCEGWVTDAYRAGNGWAEFGNSVWSFSYGDHGRDLAAPYFQDGGWGSAGLSAGLIAAQAVSALQITETAEVDTGVLNGMLRG
ncbi:Septum site-determining protein [Hibiscus syriacus]|uniref:Septum site-determining protein n=2 Tax=Hibiscus syriacus TaxID=106335 RepID=A0A6A3CHS7_HIBSY|nr:Septum site-determining protein [Hibiscus syriacus]